MRYTGVAISGKAAAGKSTLALSVLDALDARCRPAHLIQFAAPISEEVYRLTRLRKGVPGYREAMLQTGKLMREKIGQVGIAELTARKLERLIEDGVYPVIDDLRLPEEWRIAQTLGLFTVRLDAPAELRYTRMIGRGAEDPTFAYSIIETETALDDYAFHLRCLNDDTVRLGALAALIATSVVESERLVSV